MTDSKKPPALKKGEREKLESELDSGPEVDQRRDDMMRRILASPPKSQAQPRAGGKSRKI